MTVYQHLFWKGVNLIGRLLARLALDASTSTSSSPFPFTSQNGSSGIQTPVICRQPCIRKTSSCSPHWGFLTILLQGILPFSNVIKASCLGSSLGLWLEASTKVRRLIIANSAVELSRYPADVWWRIFLLFNMFFSCNYMYYSVLRLMWCVKHPSSKCFELVILFSKQDVMNG